MANALKFHTVVKGKKLTLPDLTAFEGKHVEVTLGKTRERVAMHNDASVRYRGRFKYRPTSTLRFHQIFSAISTVRGTVVEAAARYSRLDVAP